MKHTGGISPELLIVNLAFEFANFSSIQEATTEILLYKLQATSYFQIDKTQVKKVLRRELEDEDFSIDNFMNNDRELRKKGEDGGYGVGEKSRMRVKVEDGREREQKEIFRDNFLGIFLD
ncbi:unnamed protein product [Vicia faba]|uniref:Uncharacterized protein n=1 Tax=Vicia faba TaxID=3906 RepID=A0AAV0YJY0_VICFA|nr:unnamed protein product [Vicia faba]